VSHKLGTELGLLFDEFHVSKEHCVAEESCITLSFMICAPRANITRMARTRKKRNVHRILVESPEGIRPL
jgi:hypothetical protein